MHRFSSRGRASRAALVPAAAALALACNENLPLGPTTFQAKLAIVVSHDTIVVGDSSSASALATDATGHKIQALAYTWGSTDSATVGFAATATPDTAQGRSRVLVAKRTGNANVSLALPDGRFVSSSVTRSETAVVGGVKVLTTHDSTLTAVNDTGVAIAVGLVRVNGALVNRVSTGLRWTHIGQHVLVIGQGDTIKYVAKSNGADSLIASHDFCLAGAKCADTVIARVNQQLVLTIQQHSFLAWSFNDSVGPAVTLADRRGNGLQGTSIRLVPVTAADSVVVKVSQPLGISNPVNGFMAVPKLIAAANGPARAAVLGIGVDGISVVASDTITAVVRQVARRVAAEPLRATLTGYDSIPVRPISRDARGSAIADGVPVLTPAGVFFNGIWAIPSTPAAALATITPVLTGVALPSNNPNAPQIGPFFDVAQLTILTPDTAVAGTTARTVTAAVLDSLTNPAVGSTVLFRTNFGPVQASAQADFTGIVSILWQAPDSVGYYTLTGVRGGATLNSLADSTGRIVVRQSLVVKEDVPSALKSTLQISATTITAATTATITVKVKDKFGNPVRTATPLDFVLTASNAGSTFTAPSCTLGVCTITYTAPPAAGTDIISAKILGVDIVFSPITLTIN